MSYILDALKKSEQERGNGSIPDVQTVHSSSLNYRNDKNIYWPYLLITAVILNLLAIVYFIFDKENTLQQYATPQHSAVIANTAAELSAANNTQKPTTTVDNNKQPIVSPAVASSHIEQQVSNKQSAATATSTSTPPVTKDIKEEAAENSSIVLEYHDLADSIKQQLPAIIISAHVYSSNPLQRSIVVNNNFMEEGEYVIDDLILHEITTDGAIFNHNGTLFHYGVVSTWQ